MSSPEKIFLNFKANYSPFKLIASMQQGVPIEVIDSISERTDFARVQICQAIGLNTRTLNRRQTLKLDEADKLYRLVRVYALATEVLESEPDAKTWLSSPKRALNNEIPLTLLATDIGTREVELLLHRIDQGVYT